MKSALSFQALRHATDERRHDMLNELVRATKSPPNGELKELEQKIGEFERRYEMTTETMIEAVNSGALRETNEICTWLMLNKLRGRLVARVARSG